MNFFNKIFNEYNLKARVFPAILCSLPLLLTKYFIIDNYISISLSATIIGDISFDIILIYLLVQINRLISKTFFENKSDFPSIKMLIPSSKDLSDEYRRKIEKKIAVDFKMSLPTLAEEDASPEKVKLRIRELVDLIIDKVRNGNLLLQHNIEYGFVRNLVGGCVLAFIVSFACFITFGFFIKNEAAYIVSIIFCVIYLIPILFFKIIVGHFSKEYARILLREYLNLK